MRHLHIPSPKGRVCVKVDLRKAFDSVRWSFVKEVMKGLSFPPLIIELIMQCIQTPSFSVLINGSPHGFFNSNCGLRQGDPLSPILFVLTMQVLTNSIDRVVSTGAMGHFLRPELIVSHLCFADDLILFSDDSTSSALGIQQLLNDFSQASGLQINLQKSQVFLSFPDSSFSTENGISSASLLVKYLGIPLFASGLSHSLCLPLVDKVHCQLQSWSGLLLSKARKLELLKSVL
ncbi:hypothetical protein QJS10_CPB17g01017 [Acorus calamus]|uniref:Reverse transcriptase domain-containing protein n=1 Tax=Acorus calamus TaxID=4465 RepID=A0AAV9CV18_ACOCL|nr:hypothetical protein QJS10_CPB17g01017 [Acorus calamus]